jgi:hypothetical protein
MRENGTYRAAVCILRFLRSLRLLCLLCLVLALGACATFPDEVEFEGVDAHLIRGPAHCDWDDTWVLFVGPDEPLVTRGHWGW